MKYTTHAGKRQNVGSDHSWADWQKPPVICPACKKRVTLRQSFMADFDRGTFHAEHWPTVVRVVVEARPQKLSDEESA